MRGGHKILWGSMKQMMDNHPYSKALMRGPETVAEQHQF